MQNDEQEIRQLVSTWMAATQSGDVESVLKLMTDDAVFLVAGQPPMTKQDFAKAAQAQKNANLKFSAENEVQELQVLADWAFMRQKLSVTIQMENQATPNVRSGHTLTLFHKQNGKWLLARDANMLVAINKDK